MGFLFYEIRILIMRKVEIIHYELSRVGFLSTGYFYNIDTINSAFKNKINLKIRLREFYIDVSNGEFDDEFCEQILKYKRELSAIRIMR